LTFVAFEFRILFLQRNVKNTAYETYMLTCSDFLFVVGRVAASEGRSVKRRRRIKSTGTSHTDTRGVKRRAQER